MKQLRSAALLSGALFLLVGSSSLHAGVILTNIFSFNGTNGAFPSILVPTGNNKFYGITDYGGPNYAGPFQDYGGVYSITSDGVFSNLCFFENTNGTGGAYLTRGLDGNFYGTTLDSIFKLNPDGTMANPHLATLESLTLSVGMLQDRDGTLYGTTEDGGPSGKGTIYKIDTNGVFSTLFTFDGTNGLQPQTLLLGADNNFYGLARGGGNNLGRGLIFRVDRSGNLTNVFLSSDSNATPSCMVQGSDGDLYWVSYCYSYGIPGINDPGSVFRITTNGDLVWSFSFNGTNGDGGTWITAGNDGNFYGLTSWGGNGYDGTANSGFGTVFRITPNGSFTSLFQFDGTNDASPGSMIQGTDGDFYGTSLSGGAYGQGAIFKLSLSTCNLQTNLMETLFGNLPGNAGGQGELIQVGDGSLYGDATSGGDFGQGFIFKTALDGSVSNLFSFNGTNGSDPVMPLVSMPDGSFYGITQHGGIGFNGTNGGRGTVFKFSSNGVFSSVFSFDGANGIIPTSLILGSDGNLYGTAYTGGAFTNDIGIPLGTGDGTVFEVTSNGQFNVLASFDGTNGETPFCLIQANNGDFYGVAGNGGDFGNGTVFHMTPNGTLTTLFSFNGTNGDVPETLIQGSDGVLYGTTFSGGNGFTANGGGGTVFRITTNGDFSTLALLDNTTGTFPQGRLLEVCDGVFYGTTSTGGPVPYGSAAGTLFQITTNGNLKVLVPFIGMFFDYPTPPENPNGGVIEAFDGNFYGVGYGGLYSIQPVQSPFVQASGQGNQINLTWNAWAGYSYAVMYETNLTGSNWNLLSTVAPQTNGMTSFSDPFGPDTQRFYRVVLELP